MQPSRKRDEGAPSGVCGGGRTEGDVREGGVAASAGKRLALVEDEAAKDEGSQGPASERPCAAAQTRVPRPPPGASQGEVGNKGLRRAGLREGECAQRPPGVSDEGAQGGHVPGDVGVEDVGGVGAAEAAGALKAQEEGPVPHTERPQGVEEEGHLGGLLLSEEGHREVELSRAHPAGLGGGAPSRRQGQKEGGLEVFRQGTGEEEAQRRGGSPPSRAPAKHHPTRRLQGWSAPYGPG